MTRRARPSAPKISLRRKQKALEDRISRLGARREELLNGLASNHDIDRVDQQLDEARRDLAELVTVRRAKVRAARKRVKARGATRDRFAQFVAQSGGLTEWHLKVADALLESEARALGAGRSGVGVSGRAGDGDGRIVVLCGPDGEISEETLGALAVAGVAARSALARWHKAAKTRASDGRKIAPPRTFDPKGVKAVRKVSDGGMAAIVDARRESQRLWEICFEAAAGAVGGHPGFAHVVAFGAEQVIRGQMSARMVVCDLLHVKKSRGLELVETAVLAGLEGVAPRLGFGDRAERALDSGTR